jgi:phage shock protein A
MQEQAAASLRQMTELAAPGNTPSLEEVRDKIERRYANAIGSAELAQNSVQGRMLEVQASTADMAGASRLEQIRASLQGAPVAGEVTAGEKAAAPTQQLNAPQQQPGTA